ncbi:hypothetical protein D3C73_866020 [compost metagenome]
MTNCSQRAAFVGRHHALSGIFHHEQVVLSRQCHNGVHFAGNARVMHRYDSAGFVGDRRFNQRFVNVHGIRADIDKDDFGPTQHEGVGGGDKGVARHDHFITSLDIQQQCRHLKRGGTGGCQQHFRAAKMLLHPLLATTGKAAVTAQFSAAHRRLHVFKLGAYHRRCVKWDHVVTCITSTRCFLHWHRSVCNV